MPCCPIIIIMYAGIKLSHHSSFLILLVLAVSSATLSPFSDISLSRVSSFSFFFFSAHLPHSFVLITLVSSALFFFSASMFFRLMRWPMDPLPLIFFFCSLLAAASCSFFSASSFSSFSSRARCVLSMLPSTLGSMVMVSGGSLSSSLWIMPSLFCFLVSKGLFSKLSQKGTPLPGIAMLLNPESVPRPSRSSKGTNRQLFAFDFGLQVMQGWVCLLSHTCLKMSMRNPQLTASNPLWENSMEVTFRLMGQVCRTFSILESQILMFSAAVAMQPLWKPMSVMPAPTNIFTCGVPDPGVHHSTVPLELPSAIIAFDGFCLMTVQGFLATWSATMCPVVVSQYFSFLWSQPTSRK